MVDLFWMHGKDVFRDDKRVVKYGKSEDGNTLYIKEFPRERSKKEKTIQLDKAEAEKINKEIQPMLFTSELKNKLPFKVKEISFDNEEQVKQLILTLSEFLG